MALSAVACLALNWPGHFSYDSVVQLAEGRTGIYAGGHPPVMSWLLGAGAVLTPGAAAFVILDVALVAAALMAFVGLGGQSPAWAPLVALAVAPFPQILVYPAIVWKDVLFAGAVCAAFACLAHGLARWERPAWRAGLLAAAALLLALATLARQNGVLILPFATAAVAVGGAVAGRERERTRAAPLAIGLAWGAAVSLAAALAALAVSTALASHVESADGSAVSGEWRGLEAWDLVNALSLAPTTDFPVLHAQAPWLDRRLRTEGVAAYSPAKADTLEPLLGKALARADVTGLIADQWRDLALRHPWLYLRARARSFGWVFLTPDPSACVLVFTGVGGPDAEMAQARLTPRRTGLDDGIAEYALGFARTPAYSHAAFAGVGLVLAMVLVWRRRPADLAVAAMLGAVLAFAASFAVISVACDYRYLYPLDLAVIAALLYTAAAWRDPRPGVRVLAAAHRLRGPP